MESKKTIEVNGMKFDGLKKVYKSSGMNACDMNGMRQLLPDNLEMVNGIQIDGVWYVPFTVVEI